MPPLRPQRDGPPAVLTIERPPLSLFDRAMLDALEQVRSFLERGPGHADFEGR